MLLSLNTVHNLDCMDLLSQLDDESVDLFLCDPPYFMGNKPFINRVKKYKRMVAEWDNQWKSELVYWGWCLDWGILTKKKLKPGGVILVTGTFHNAFGMHDLLGDLQYTFRNFITWFKPNAMPIFMAKKMGAYAYSCEYINYFSKGKVAYFGYDYLKELNNGKQHRDIFIVNNRPHSESVGHPTQKPLVLWNPLVQAHCPPDGLVVDFFAGSGTTGVVAKQTGRNYILGEASEAYCEMIKERLNEV